MLLFEDLEGEDPKEWMEQVIDRLGDVEEKIVKLRPLALSGADGERDNAKRAIEKFESEIRDLRMVLIWTSLATLANRL